MDLIEFFTENLFSVNKISVIIDSFDMSYSSGAWNN